MSDEDDATALCKTAINSSPLDCYVSVSQATDWRISDVIYACSGATTGEKAQCILRSSRSQVDAVTVTEACSAVQ